VSHPSLSEFREQVGAWLDDARPPRSAEFEALLEWQRTLFEAGLVGIAWPCESGGRGLTWAHQATFDEELARRGMPAPVGRIGIDIIGPTLLAHGSPDQVSRYLPAILRGDEIWCQGFSEPEAGSDLASLRTLARRDGDIYVVNGHKIWTSLGDRASWCALLARTDADAPKHQGISYLLVPMDLPGVTVHPIVQMTGETEFSEVWFDDVEIPVGNIIGAENQGWPLALSTLSHERGLWLIRRRSELGREWHEFGLELLEGGARATENELLQLGAVATMMHVLDATTDATVARLIDGIETSFEDSVDKLILSEVEQTLGRCVVQMLGPHVTSGGLTPRALDAGRWVYRYFSGRSASIYGGTAQIQRSIVAKAGLGLPSEVRRARN